MSLKPEISIVVVSRNDNHGGDMLKRMRIFTKGLLFQCKKFKIKTELVFVEWNPDENKPKLHEVLPLPEQQDFLKIRYIRVPNAIHNQLKHAADIPLFQMIGKNVGIRRSKADFIICTNVDLLFSDELMKKIKSPLDEHKIYRANRCDIPKNIDESISVEQQLSYAQSNILQRLGKHHLYPEIVNTSSKLYHLPFYGYLKSLNKKLKRLLNKETFEEFIARIDTDACGDFTMMHRKGWQKIRGYYELEAYSIHLDSIAVIQAVISGLEQKIFPYTSCTYHISHDNGWELSDPIEKMYMDLEKPMLDWSTVYALCKKMKTEEKLIHINDENWGFANEKFKEYIFEPGKEMQEIN